MIWQELAKSAYILPPHFTTMNAVLPIYAGARKLAALPRWDKISTEVPETEENNFHGSPLQNPKCFSFNVPFWTFGCNAGKCPAVSSAQVLAWQG